jgi:hypothetical protein
MTFIKDGLTLEKAMEAVSGSVADFKRFIEALNRFLEANKLGSASWDETDQPELDDHGFDIAMFHLSDSAGKDAMYLYIYTDGTVTGENFALGHEKSRFGDSPRCSWDGAVREILKTVGVLQHTPLSREKIDKAIELFG